MNIYNSLIAAVIAGIAASTAVAQSEPLTTQVSYADLNLASEAGVETLKHRIRTASKGVCPNARDDTPIHVARCRNQAKESAFRQLNVAVAKARATPAVEMAAR